MQIDTLVYLYIFAVELMYLIGYNFHAEDLSVNNYVRENKVRDINVRDFQVRENHVR